MVCINKKLIFLSLLILSHISSFSRQQVWTFDSNAKKKSLVRIHMQNETSNVSFRLFWTTETDAEWDMKKSVTFTASSNDTTTKEYKINTSQLPEWKGSIKQVRIEPENSTLQDALKISLINLESAPADLTLNNGTILLKMDLNRGGAITHISKNSDKKNLVNTYDAGRYIQQSYYAGQTKNRQEEGQSPNWSPWNWNPIQGGDYAYNQPEILEWKETADSLYVKCVPLLWDMNNMKAEATMEQWTTMEKENVIKVKNKLTCNRTDDTYGNNMLLDQELPAVYTISSLNNLYAYTGDDPFTNAPLENIPVVNLSSGFWGTYYSITEKWMAFVDNKQFGLGVYTPIATFFLAGKSGTEITPDAAAISTNYIAPIKKEILKKKTVFEYEYYLIIGSLSEIRSAVYSINGSDTSNYHPSAEGELNIYPNPAKDSLFIDIDKKVSIHIYNSNGKLIHKEKLSPEKNHIDISKLLQGHYFLKVEINGETKIAHFIKL